MEMEGQQGVGDLAAELYALLRERKLDAAQQAIARAAARDEAAWVRVSESHERRSVPGSDGQRRWLVRGRTTFRGREPSESEADYATRGLTALHVLARDAPETTLVLAALQVGGAAGLQVEGGFDEVDNEVRGWRPVHLAGRENSRAVVHSLVDAAAADTLQHEDKNGSRPIHHAAAYNGTVGVLQYLIEVGGAEQLQLENKYGARPIHVAAAHNGNVGVLQYLIEVGGAEQLQLEAEDGLRPIHH
eukprot:COSAG02_NODE_1381_length_12972_cov_75.630700_12_plen_245_part_01